MTRRRTKAGLWAGGCYLLLVGGLSLAGARPSLVLLGATGVALLSLLLFIDAALGADDSPWPGSTVSTRGLGRGADHRTVALARRLEGAEASSPGSRQHLSDEVRAQLVDAVVSRVQRSHGLDPRADPRVLALLPPELAALVRGPADERLLDPTTLTHLLDRIEQL